MKPYIHEPKPNYLSAPPGAPGGLEEGETIYEKENRRGATPAYCRRTPCRKMGFTQKASCKSQDIKDCYRKNKKGKK